MRTTLRCVLVVALGIAAWAGAAPGRAGERRGPALKGSVSFLSDYRFRGISQTLCQPAAQGSLDWTWKSGLYASLFGSSVSGAQYNDGGLELDVVVGKSGSLGRRWTWTAGLARYFYPGANLPALAGGWHGFHTTEVFAGASTPRLDLKYWTSLTDGIGINQATSTYASGGTERSPYVEGTWTAPLPGGTSIQAHLGRQGARNAPALAYTEAKVGLTRRARDLSLGLAWHWTSARADAYTWTRQTGGPVNCGGSAVVATVSRPF